jgi:hypothetical protein
MYGSMVTFELPAARGHQAPWLSDHMLSFSTLLLFVFIVAAAFDDDS